MSGGLVYRSVVHVEFDDIEVEVLRPESVVLIYRESVNSPSCKTADLGCFCYRSRSKSAGKKGVGTAVDLTSLDVDRIPVVKRSMDFFRSGGPRSVETKYGDFKKFYDWIDCQEKTYVFSDYESMKTAYCDYSNYLNHTSALSRLGGGINRTTANGYQASAAILISLVLDIPVHKVRSFTFGIPRNRGQIDRLSNLSSQEERSRTFAALVNFIGEVHRVVVEGGGLPIKFHSPSDEDFFYYLPQQIGDKKEDMESFAYYLKSFKEFPKFFSVVESLGLNVEGERRKILKSAHSNCRNSARRILRDPRCKAAIWLANRAISASLITFISATGTNFSVAQELVLDTEQVEASTQGKRYSGAKGRAEGKEVHPEFGTDYLPVYKKIRDLRSWILNGRESQLLFPYQTEQGSISRLERWSLKELKRMFSVALPNTVWVTPTQWRKGVGSEYIKLSDGDTVLAAEKLGNSEAIVRQHYARPSVDDTAVELTMFFDSVYNQAIGRTRSLDQIPVKIQDREEVSNIPTGCCNNSEELTPVLAPGFTSLAPAPSCGEPATCLFCSFYGVHADEQDVRRLLSLQYLLRASKGSMANERYLEKIAPMLHRIDEVIAEVEQVSNIQPTLVSTIRAQVEGGALDSFWEIHFNTFVSVGLVS